MHEGFLQCRSAVGDEGEGFHTVFRAHRGLEVGEREAFGRRLPGPPMDEQTHHHPAQHAQEQQPFGRLRPATVIDERHIKALVAAVFNPPALPVGRQPLPRRKLCRRQIGLQRYRFGRPPAALPREPGPLRGFARDSGLQPYALTEGRTAATRFPPHPPGRRTQLTRKPVVFYHRLPSSPPPGVPGTAATQTTLRAHRRPHRTSLVPGPRRLAPISALN